MHDVEEATIYFARNERRGEKKWRRHTQNPENRIKIPTNRMNK